MTMGVAGLPATKGEYRRAFTVLVGHVAGRQAQSVPTGPTVTQ